MFEVSHIYQAKISTILNRDAAHQKTAVDLANQLIAHLNAKIAEMPNDPDKFLLKGKLGEIAEQLKVGNRKLMLIIDQ